MIKDGYKKEIEKTLLFQTLNNVQLDFSNNLRSIGRSDDILLITDTERNFIGDDLLRYANSKFERFYRRLVPYF
ncbi:hypothetical protein [Bartonella rochalimae]|uniref:Uncharacterized protein n=1 Tax=Bartonella rochalimae ATCC BAA-1498 TaxID=685782 RepID=E6YLK9_9HYPH|nr:hypothetical protein [Bartonella rochalimae]KEC56756.1 hypothetical protein O99_00178 [Bartonella rochalimae ATCC BAA-1498]CBI77761.1 hypothetical protein BARRO_50110 [Bartonella rochalimae ATCC BAA-1498]